jgi:uncharacterized protein YydD (DUF2326 family)
MIRAVRCNEPSFHAVEFGPGLNVVLADRTQESTKTDSRNGLGKSTLIEIIHFCLGAGTRRNKGLLVPPLEGWTFTLDLVVQGRNVSVSRSTASPNVIGIEGDVTGWPMRPDRDEETGALVLAVQQWRDVLGYLIFGLPLATDTRYAPTFRGLISFFIRRSRDAYSVPFEIHRKQTEVDKQVYNSFLLGLEWHDAAEFQVLKDRKKAIEDLQRAAEEGLLVEYVGSRGELEALRVRLESRYNAEQEQINTFRVHPQYDDIVRRADELTTEIHDLSNQNAIDRRYLTLYQQTLSDERAPSARDVQSLYEEAGVALPSLVVQRLDAVETFHGELIANRREFLSSEISRLDREIDQRAQVVGEKTSRRAELMTVLTSHGALAEYTQLQQLHSVTLSQLEEVKRRIQDLKAVEEGKSALAIEQQVLLQRARRDLEERAATVNEAIRLFNENSEALYSGAAGTLVIEVRQTGFQFRVDIERSGSQGIDSMKVFCYDLTLMQLWAQRSPSPGFLVHDSTIFDGVDERQIAAALERAASESERLGFQYICALNSDTVPWREFSAGFDLTSFVRLRLTDATEDGRLLGMRF